MPLLYLITANSTMHSLCHIDQTTISKTAVMNRSASPAAGDPPFQIEQIPGT